MRIAVWAFILASALTAVGMFLPALALPGSDLLGNKATVSMFRAARDKELGARFIVAYRASKTRKVGPAVVKALTPRVGGKVGSMLGDAGDAMSTLDTVSAKDASTLGTVLAVTVYAFLALEALAIGILFGRLIEAKPIRARRIGASLALTTLLAAISVGIFLGLEEVRFQANDEIGARVLELATGAYLLPVAALTALAAALAAFVLALRRGPDIRVRDPRDPANAPSPST